MAPTFVEGNGESLQTAKMGFVVVSHDIISDGASRGCEPNPFQGYAHGHKNTDTHPHTYTQV